MNKGVQLFARREFIWVQLRQRDENGQEVKIRQ